MNQVAKDIEFKTSWSKITKLGGQSSGYLDINENISIQEGDKSYRILLMQPYGNIPAYWFPMALGYLKNNIPVIAGGVFPTFAPEICIKNDLIDIDKLKFVSFTVNPDYDTPEVLKKYAKRYDADISTWSFVTGKYEQIQELIANGFKMGDEEEIVFHSTRFALVDHEGNLRGYYSGTEPMDHENLTRDIHSLVKKIQ